MTVLYKLSKEQLSSQHHYDFGLRALKSVLVMAGSLKRSSPDMSEALVLMRALRDMNLPKFVYDDVPLFLGFINDLFPGMASYDQLTCVVSAGQGSVWHGVQHAQQEIYIIMQSLPVRSMTVAFCLFCVRGV